MCVGARTAAPAVWSSGMLAPGAPCVMIPGTWQMQRSCAASWAVAQLWVPLQGLLLGQARALCGWMRWGAVAASRPCGAVLRSHGDLETADTRRMLVCTAPVSGQGAVGQAGWEGLLGAAVGVARRGPWNIPQNVALRLYLSWVPLAASVAVPWHVGLRLSGTTLG